MSSFSVKKWKSKNLIETQPVFFTINQLATSWNRILSNSSYNVTPDNITPINITLCNVTQLFNIDHYNWFGVETVKYKNKAKTNWLWFVLLTFPTRTFRQTCKTKFCRFGESCFSMSNFHRIKLDGFVETKINFSNNIDVLLKPLIFHLR